MDTIRRFLKDSQKVVRLPSIYGVEYLVTDGGNPHSWVTFNRVSGIKEGSASARYSAKTVSSGIDLYRTTGVPFCCCAAFDDCICNMRVYNTDGMELILSEVGEPVYSIPHTQFAVRFRRDMQR